MPGAVGARFVSRHAAIDEMRTGTGVIVHSIPLTGRGNELIQFSHRMRSADARRINPQRRGRHPGVLFRSGRVARVGDDRESHIAVRHHSAQAFIFSALDQRQNAQFGFAMIGISLRAGIRRTSAAWREQNGTREPQWVNITCRTSSSRHRFTVLNYGFA